RKKFFRVPIVDLSGNANAEPSHVEVSNRCDASFLGENSVPKTFDTFANAGNWPKSCDDYASSSLPRSLVRRRAHAVTVFARASTYCFIQSNVLLATLPMKKSPIIGS